MHSAGVGWEWNVNPRLVMLASCFRPFQRLSSLRFLRFYPSPIELPFACALSAMTSTPSRLFKLPGLFLNRQKWQPRRGSRGYNKACQTSSVFLNKIGKLFLDTAGLLGVNELVGESWEMNLWDGWGNKLNCNLLNTPFVVAFKGFHWFARIAISISYIVYQGINVEIELSFWLGFIY